MEENPPAAVCLPLFRLAAVHDSLAWSLGGHHGPDLPEEGVGPLAVAAVVGLALAREEVSQVLLLLATLGGSHPCTPEKCARRSRMPSNAGAALFLSFSGTSDASRNGFGRSERFTPPPSRTPRSWRWCLLRRTTRYRWATSPCTPYQGCASLRSTTPARCSRPAPTP